MAYVQKLPDDALDAIAKQVGKLYASLDNNVTQRQPSAELTETFPVWLKCHRLFGPQFRKFNPSFVARIP